MKIEEKWESDPALLRLRGFGADGARTPQLICRNAYPSDDVPFPFFLCEYAPKLKARLSPSAFPSLPSVNEIILGLPNPHADWSQLDRLLGLPAQGLGVEILILEESNPLPAVVEIRTGRGPLELTGWATRFRFF